VWTFGSILDDNGKKELDAKIKATILPHKTDFASY
jgi:hypothetical protein